VDLRRLEAGRALGYETIEVSTKVEPVSRVPANPGRRSTPKLFSTLVRIPSSPCELPGGERGERY